MFNFAKLKNQDPVIVVLTLIISFIGLITVFSTTFFPSLGASVEFIQQVLFSLVGILLYLLIAAFDTELIKQPKLQLLLFLVTVAVLTLTLATPTVGFLPKRWITLGEVSIQPSEFAKILIILITATAFAEDKTIKLVSPINVYKKWRQHKLRKLLTNKNIIRFLLSSIAVWTIVALVLVQPSLGNAVLTFGLWVLMLSTLVKNPISLLAYVAILILGINLVAGMVNFFPLYDSIGVPIGDSGIDILLVALTLIIILILRKLLKLNNLLIIIFTLLGMLTMIGSGFVWNNVLEEYQRDRIVFFITPEEDPLGSQWQVEQSITAIVSGQIFGKGFLLGTQSNLHLLPYAHTDFVFAAFSEQFGLVGSTFLLITYLLLFWRILQLAQQTTNNFGRLVCIGVTIMIALNVVVNVGMNLNIMPVTGVPLPLISAGGSAVVANLIGLGLVQMIYSERKKENMEVVKIKANK